MKPLHGLVKDDSGATAIEYGLIAGLVAIVIITALLALGPQLRDTFQRVTDEMETAAQP